MSVALHILIAELWGRSITVPTPYANRIWLGRKLVDPTTATVRHDRAPRVGASTNIGRGSRTSPAVGSTSRRLFAQVQMLLDRGWPSLGKPLVTLSRSFTYRAGCLHGKRPGSTNRSGDAAAWPGRRLRRAVPATWPPQSRIASTAARMSGVLRSSRCTSPFSLYSKPPSLRGRLRRVRWPGEHRTSGRCRRSGGQQPLLEARHVDGGEPSPGR